MKYRFTQTYKAQNANITDKTIRNDLPRFTTFNQGAVVSGVMYNPSDQEMRLRFPPSIIVNGAYIVPLSVVLNTDSSKIGADGVGHIASSDQVVQAESVISKGHKIGFVLGGISGAGLAMLFRWSIWKVAIIGALAGGYIGYKVSESTTEVQNFKIIG